MRVDDQIIKSVLFLGTYTERTGFIPLGTAFLYSVEVDGMAFGQVVTARHNVEDRARVFLRVNKKDGGAFLIQIERDWWIFHPDSKSYIDVAVLPVGNIQISQTDVADMDVSNFPAEFLLTNEVIERLKIAPGEPVVTIGMFTSHYGEIHNTPIVRVGNIAAMRSADDLVFTSKGYMDAYLVEVRSLGGLSGSPVLVQMAPSRIIDGKIVHASQVPMKPFYLLGVMRGHFTTREPNDFVFPGSRGPDKHDDADESPDEFNAGIGVVVPFDKVLETINQPHLVEERKRVADEAKRRSGEHEDSAQSGGSPSHREDFTRLLGAAAKGKQSDDQTSRDANPDSSGGKKTR